MEELKVPPHVREYFKEFSGELGEDAKVWRKASCVWDWLKQNKAPAEIIGAFDDLCKRLRVPYVLVGGGERSIGCERCGYPVNRDWVFCPRCGKPADEPISGTEVMLRGLLGYHQRLKNTEKANGEGESPMADIYEASLIDAISAVREREQNQLQSSLV